MNRRIELAAWIIACLLWVAVVIALVGVKVM